MAAQAPESVAALAPGTSGEALTKGDAVYVKKSDGKFYKASNVFNREQAQVLGLVKIQSTLQILGSLLSFAAHSKI